MKTKNKKGNWWALLLLFLTMFLAAGLVYWKINLDPVDLNNTNTQVFVVNKGESLKEVAQTLEQKKLIRNWWIFVLQAKRLGLQGDIQAGNFTLSPSYTVAQMFKELNHGTMDSWVTIPEGWRDAQIGQRLNEQLGISQSEFVRQAREGFMFPDTYLIPKGTTDVTGIVKLMRENFNKRIVSIDSEALDTNRKFSGLTLNEIVTLASLVEREAKLNQDRPIIAGILLKRLQNDWPLEVDATLQYALGYDASEKNWWRKNLTADDLNLNSPFNTRKNKGLPPLPICNPGLASLQAVFDPVSSPYWFYLSDKNGTMHYAKTIEEHNLNVAKYL